MNNNYQIKEDFIIQIMKKGLIRAAESFSNIIDKEVSLSKTSLVSLKNIRFKDKENNEAPLYIITTQLIGSIHGKSFLILHQREFNEIVKLIGDQNNQEVKEGFLLEIDNIISATVISNLSNELSKEVYGDVPKLFMVKTSDVQNFIHQHTLEYSGLILQSELQIEGVEIVTLLFTWVLDSKITALVPTKNLVV